MTLRSQQTHNVREGQRLLLGGWAAVVLVCAAGVPLAEMLVGDFGDGRGPIVMRGWMKAGAAVVLALHVAAMIPVFVGAKRCARAFGGAPLRGAAWAFALVVMLCAVSLVVLALVGAGPWTAEAWQPRVLWGLVFGPSILRALGFSLLVLALGKAPFGASRSWVWALMVLSLLDIAACLSVCLNTASALVPRLHPANVEPWLMAPFLLAGVIFLGLGLRSGREPAS